jgi:hypothetical protein
MSAYATMAKSDQRYYVRTVPAIGAAQYPANSCGKNFDRIASSPAPAYGPTQGPTSAPVMTTDTGMAIDDAYLAAGGRKLTNKDEAPGGRKLASHDEALAVTCSDTDLGSLLMDPYTKLVGTVYTIHEIHHSAVLAKNLTWSVPVLHNASGKYDVPLKITLKAARAGIKIYWVGLCVASHNAHWSAMYV